MACDLDDFKTVNTRYGHPEGDRVLQEAAKALTAAVRDGDLVARLGGDEFAIVAAGADDPGMEALSKRVAIRLEENDLVAEHGAHEAERLARRPLRPEVRAIGHEAEELLRRDRLLRHVHAVYQSAAAGWAQQSRQEADRRRLAGAVGSHQREERPRRDGGAGV